MSEPSPSSPEPAVERRARAGPPDGVERRARPAEADAAAAGPPPESIERRNVPGAPGFVERRRRPTPMLSRFTFVGGRRGSDPSTRPDESYVDVYDARSAILVLVFFGLTVFDAIATVYYIDHVQGSEWNPIADWLLQQGRLFFVLGKGVPTGLLLLFVMIHKNYRYGRVALTIGFGFYFLLGIYHVVLQLLAFALEAGLWHGV